MSKSKGDSTQVAVKKQFQPGVWIMYEGGVGFILPSNKVMLIVFRDKGYFYHVSDSVPEGASELIGVSPTRMTNGVHFQILSAIAVSHNFPGLPRS